MMEKVIYWGLRSRGIHQDAISQCLFKGKYMDDDSVGHLNDEIGYIAEWMCGNFEYDMTVDEGKQYTAEKRALSMLFQVACFKKIIDNSQLTALMNQLPEKTDLLQLTDWRIRMFEAKPELESLWKECVQ